MYARRWFGAIMLVSSLVTQFCAARLAGARGELVAWLLVVAFLRPTMSQLARTFRETFRQMWGALLVAPFIFGLANVWVLLVEILR